MKSLPFRKPAPHEGRNPRGGRPARFAVRPYRPRFQKGRVASWLKGHRGSSQIGSRSIPTGLWRQNRYCPYHNHQSTAEQNAPFSQGQNEAFSSEDETRRESYRQLDPNLQYYRTRGWAVVRRSFRRKFSPWQKDAPTTQIDMRRLSDGSSRSQTGIRLQSRWNAHSFLRTRILIFCTQTRTGITS